MRIWPLWRQKCRSCADMRAACDAQMKGLIERVQTSDRKTMALWYLMTPEQRAASKALPKETP